MIFEVSNIKYCVKLILAERPQLHDPCSQCGQNALCHNGQCSCPPEYPKGDPYSYQGCQPECINNYDCNTKEACLRNKCVDVCSNNICGRSAICEAFNHVATCTCPPGMQGNAFIECRPYQERM